MQRGVNQSELDTEVVFIELEPSWIKRTSRSQWQHKQSFFFFIFHFLFFIFYFYFILLIFFSLKRLLLALEIIDRPKRRRQLGTEWQYRVRLTTCSVFVGAGCVGSWKGLEQTTIIFSATARPSNKTWLMNSVFMLFAGTAIHTNGKWSYFSRTNTTTTKNVHDNDERMDSTLKTSYKTNSVEPFAGQSGKLDE